MNPKVKIDLTYKKLPLLTKAGDARPEGVRPLPNHEKSHHASACEQSIAREEPELSEFLDNSDSVSNESRSIVTVDATPPSEISVLRSAQQPQPSNSPPSIFSNDSLSIAQRTNSNLSRDSTQASCRTAYSLLISLSTEELTIPGPHTQIPTASDAQQLRSPLQPQNFPPRSLSDHISNASPPSRVPDFQIPLGTAEPIISTPSATGLYRQDSTGGQRPEFQLRPLRNLSLPHVMRSESPGGRTGVSRSDTSEIIHMRSTPDSGDSQNFSSNSTCVPSQTRYDVSTIHHIDHGAQAAIYRRVSCYGALITAPMAHIYLSCLLWIPSLYYLHINKLLEETDLTVEEIRGIIACTSITKPNRGTHRGDLFEMTDVVSSKATYLSNPSSGYRNLYELLRKRWCEMIDDLIEEWRTLNIVSVILVP